MNAGLLWAADILEYSLTGAAAYTRSGTQGVQAAAGLASEFSLDSVLTAVGIRLTIGTSIASGSAAGSGTGYERLEIPVLSVDETDSITGGWVSSLTARVEFDDFELWCVAVAGVFKLRIKASDMRFYSSAGLYYTHGAAIQLDSSYWAPSGIPIQGVGPTLSASAAVNPAITQGALAGVCVAQNVYATASMDAEGGFRFKLAGEASWSDLPVTLNILEPPALACDISATRDDPVATSTWGATVSAYQASSDVSTYRGTVECDQCTNGTAVVPAVYDVWDRVVEWTNRSAQVTLIPDLTKSVQRWGDGSDYRALIERGGLPWAKQSSAAYCTDWWADTTDTDTDEVELHPEYTAMLLPVDNAASLIEDPFGETTYAPYSLGTLYFRARNFCAQINTPGTCPAVLPEEPPGTIIPCVTGTQDAYTSQLVSQFLPDVQESSGAGSNPDMLSYLDHAEPLHRYVNYNANPHWSFSYYFPPNTEDTDDDGIDDQQQVWQLDNADIAYEYYTDSRRQWITHPALDPADDHQTTNSLVSAPLRDGQMSLQWKGIWGTETSPWGIVRFIPYQWEPLTSVTLDSTSEDLWTGTDCTLTFGAQVAVNASADECTVDLALNSLSEPPYLYPQICDSVTLGWDLTNVDNIKVYLVNALGEEFLITDNVEGTFSYATLIATLTDSYYAGSWKQDFGVGYITDEGADSLPSGVSGATMSDTDRVTAFQLLHGLQGANLRYKITPTDHTGADVELDYPVFTASTPPKVYQEQGHHAAIIHEDGPGVRFGSWRWFDYFLLTALPFPVVEPPGTRWAGYGHKSSVLDFLRFKNVLARSEAYDDGFATDIALFDPDEGTTAGDAAIDTLSFLVNGTGEVFGILVNTWREVPPLAMFPWRARDADFEPTGSYVQEAWSLAQSPRRYVSSSGAIHVVNPTGPSTWTTLETTLGNWSITAHEHIIGNDEPLFWITNGGTEIAQGRPWWGYFAVVPDGVADDAHAAVCVAHDRSRADRHVFAWIKGTGTSGLVVIARSPNVAPYQMDTTEQAITAEWCWLRFDRNSAEQTLYLVTEESNAINVRTSTDEGRTFTVATTIGTGGTKPALEISELDGKRFYYWINGTAIKGKIYDAKGNVLEAEFTAVASLVGDYGIVARERVINAGERKITLTYIDTSNNVVNVESDDGITFS